MVRNRRFAVRAGLGALAAAAVLVPAAAAAFVEPVKVLEEWHGAGGGYFGWAVSELGDVNGDGVQEAISGEPYTGDGITYVFSGRTGKQLYRLPGRTGDQQGYAIADAGDTNGDRVPDILSGAPGSGPGHAYLYSGRSGKLLHTFAGQADGDAFGAAVASAGDVDRDGRADILIGATQASGNGAAYIYSGRTHRLIRTLAQGDGADQFGSATDWTRDLNRDHVPDQIVGAEDAGPANGGAAYVFSGKSGKLLFRIDPPASAVAFGSFFVAGVSDVNQDHRPDVYVGDYADGSLGPGTGRGAIYSGRDGHELLAWTGSAAGEGFGPGREAGDVNHDHRPDIAVGSYTSSDGAPGAGQIEIFSGRDGSLLRRITSTVAGENLGFDAVGVGDVNHDRIPDLLGSAATGDTVYLIKGVRP
jgi:hypothetical protein